MPNEINFEFSNVIDLFFAVTVNFLSYNSYPIFGTSI